MQKLGCTACQLDGVPVLCLEKFTTCCREVGALPRPLVLLCPWHHRGVLPSGRKAEEFAEVHGPSLALTPNAFRRRYGDEEELLAIQDALLDHYLETIGVDT